MKLFAIDYVRPALSCWINVRVARNSAVGMPGGLFYVGDRTWKATCARPCRLEAKSWLYPPATPTTSFATAEGSCP